MVRKHLNTNNHRINNTVPHQGIPAGAKVPFQEHRQRYQEIVNPTRKTDDKPYQEKNIKLSTKSGKTLYGVMSVKCHYGH